jgi:hypothetical protein
MCKCFGVCKCKWIYYLPFMTIVFWKSMVIGCGCIPKLKLFLQWATLIGPSQKIMILWYYPNIKTFCTNMGLWWCYFEEIFLMQILLRLITWIQLLLLLFLWIVLNNDLYYQVLFIVAFTRTLILIVFIVIHIN